MKNHIQKKLRKNNGITGIDASIAVFILMIFIPMIAGLISNINNMSNKIARRTRAVNIAVQVIEGVKFIDYDEIPNDKIDLNKALENTDGYNADNLPKGYSVDISVGKQDKDRYKEIVVNVNYKENIGIETIQLKTRIYK